MKNHPYIGTILQGFYMLKSLGVRKKSIGLKGVKEFFKEKPTPKELKKVLTYLIKRGVLKKNSNGKYKHILG